MIISTGNYAYDQRTLEAEQTAGEFAEARRISIASGMDSDPNKRFGVAWGNFMRLRRIGTYMDFSRLQKQEIHMLGTIYEGRQVCVCGLLTTVPANSSNDFEEFSNFGGHIFTPTRDLVSIFVVRAPISPELGGQYRYWCQICGDLGMATQTNEGIISRAHLKDLRGSHECSVTSYPEPPLSREI